MIFDYYPHPQQPNGQGAILVPIDIDPYEMLELLDATFSPFPSRNIGICCYGDYENALEFI